MFTATLKSVDKENASVRIIVTYTNGTQVFDETHNFNGNQDLKSIVASRIAQLNRLYAYAETLQPGPIDPPVDPALSAEQIEMKAFRQEFILLTKLKNLAELGVINKADAVYTTQQDKVASLLKPEYLSVNVI